MGQLSNDSWQLIRPIETRCVKSDNAGWIGGRIVSISAQDLRPPNNVVALVSMVRLGLTAKYCAPSSLFASGGYWHDNRKMGWNT